MWMGKKEISERCCYFIIKADFERSKSNENNNSQKHTHPNTTMFEFWWIDGLKSNSITSKGLENERTLTHQLYAR